MEKFVKVTNITHQSSREAFGAWIANKYLEPGRDCTVPLSLLPPDWQTMGTIFTFEFLGEVSPDPVTPPTTLNSDSLKELLREVVQEVQNQLRPVEPAITRADILEILSRVSQAPPASTVSESPGVSATVPMFIPSIREVESSQIEVETKIEKVGSVADLRAKLKRSQG
jgi:hypothetical protein